MKKVTFLFGFFIAIFILTTVTGAQNKGNLTPLAANASLTETQNWLVSALERNNKVKADSGKGSVRVLYKYKVNSIELSGCQLSFSRTTTISNRNISSYPSNDSSDFSYASKTGGTVITDPNVVRDTANAHKNSFYREINFDFRLKASDLLNIIKYEEDLTELVITSGGHSAQASQARMYVKRKDAPAIIAGFKQLATLCRIGN